MRTSRRRLSSDLRRSELLALGSEAFAKRPYGEVHMDEIAVDAGVSRTLMYHYFPDKRAFFAAVVRNEAERLFEATQNPPSAGHTLFERVRAGVLANVDYHRRHPQALWAVHVRMGRYDPVLVEIDDEIKSRQRQLIVAAASASVPAALENGLPPAVDRDLRVTVSGWQFFATEMCRQTLMDPSIDAEYIADACAYALFDAVARVPGIPAELVNALAPGPRLMSLPLDTMSR